jgi:hypothetical protein
MRDAQQAGMLPKLLVDHRSVAVRFLDGRQVNTCGMD